MEPRKNTLISIVFAACLLAPRGYSQAAPEAQTMTDPEPAPLTYGERMQRSVLKQIESAARMQNSIERQRSAVGRRSADPGSGSAFFAMPAPSHVPVTLTPQRAEDNAPGQSAEPAEKLPEGGKDDDVPPPGLIPFDPASLPKAIAPIEGVRPISSIRPIPGANMGSASASAAQQLLEGMMAPGLTSQRSSQLAPQRAGGSPWLEDLLKGLSGPAPAQSTGQSADAQHPQSNSGGDYSGRDSAPLTSFSLVNLLLGL